MPALHPVEERSGIVEVDAWNHAAARFRYGENNPGAAGGLRA